MGVNSIFCPTEFDILPLAIIDSGSDGEGAELYPIIRFVPKFATSSEIAINEVGVLKVVDCV